MNKKSVGRHHKLPEEEVKTIIKLFKEEEKPAGLIKYSDIYRFANKLYHSNRISASTSDSFWRKQGRLGRILVDEANIVFTDNVLTSKGDKVSVPNVVDLVHKKYKDKDDLIKHLIVMESQFRKSLQREKKLKEEYTVLEERLSAETEKNRNIKEQNKSLQEIIYRLYRILSDSNSKDVQEKTEYAMKTVFESPTSFFKMDEQKHNSYESIVSINKKKTPNNTFSNKFRKD
ncbi:hypothetical protein [Priestia aryabhattai]